MKNLLALIFFMLMYPYAIASVESATCIERSCLRAQAQEDRVANEHIENLLTQERLGDLESYFNAMQKQYEKGQLSVDVLDRRFGLFTKISLGSGIQKWVAQYPSSYAANTAAAAHFQQRGVDARGGKFASETPREKLGEMGDYFQISRAHLDKALKLSKQPTTARIIDMSVSMRSGDKARFDALYKQVLMDAPSGFRARELFFVSRLPQWYGAPGWLDAKDYIERCKVDRVSANDVRKLESLLRVEMADVSRRGGKLDDALRVYQEAAGFYESFRVIQGIISVLMDLKRHSEAMPYIDELLVRNPNDTWALVCQGKSFRAMGMKEKSVKSFERCADLSSSNCLYNLGMAYANGLGVPADKSKGIELIKISAGMNYKPAIDALRESGISR